MWVSFNYFYGLDLPLECVNDCGGGGQVDNYVAEWLQDENIKKQLAAIEPEKIAKELSEYGAWDEEELKDEQENQMRILWIAAGNLYDEMP